MKIDRQKVGLIAGSKRLRHPPSVATGVTIRPEPGRQFARGLACSSQNRLLHLGLAGSDHLRDRKELINPGRVYRRSCPLTRPITAGPAVLGSLDVVGDRSLDR